MNALPAEQQDPRDDLRSNLGLAAELHWGSQRNQVRVRDMSRRGAQLEATLLPSIGTAVKLVRMGNAVEGMVVWTSNHHIGLRFNSSISVPTWVSSNPLPSDKLTGDDASLARHFEPQAVDGAWMLELSSDLGVLAGMVEDLSHKLSGDSHNTIKNALELQNCDLAVQLLNSICEELRQVPHVWADAAIRRRKLRQRCTELGWDRQRCPVASV